MPIKYAMRKKYIFLQCAIGITMNNDQSQRCSTYKKFEN